MCLDLESGNKQITKLPVPHPPILIFLREFFSASAKFGVFSRISSLSPAEVTASAGVSRSLSLVLEGQGDRSGIKFEF